MVLTILYLIIQFFAILALIAIYFFINISKKWKTMDMDTIKSRVFLNKEFLQRNWSYIFLSSASMIIHQFLEHLMDLNYLPDNGLGTIQKFSDSVIFHDENQNNLVTNQPP